MSLNQLIDNKNKPWLNVRVNNLTVDGNTNIPGSDHYDSSDNSFQANNETTERPANTINIGGVIVNSGNINSVSLLGLVNGNDSISVGDNDIIGNDSLAIGNNINLDSSNSIVLGSDMNINSGDRQIVIGNNNPQGQGQSSILMGYSNTIRSLNEPSNILIIGGDNDLGFSSLNLGSKTTILGFNNNVSDLIETSGAEASLIVGMDNNLPEGKNSIVFGKNNTLTGGRTDCIVVGEGNTVSNDGELVLGGDNITSVKIKNLATSTTGNPVLYDPGTGEMFHNNTVTFEFPITQNGVVNVSSTGNFTISLPWRFSNIKFELINNGVYNNLYSAEGSVGDSNLILSGGYYKVLYITGTTVQDITTEMAFATTGSPIICFKAIDGVNECVIEYVSKNTSGGTFNCTTYSGFPAGLEIIWTAWG